MKQLAIILFTISIALVLVGSLSEKEITNFELNPLNQSIHINTDTRLIIEFNETPELNSKGTVRVYKSNNNELVDFLDLSIPAGPNVRREYNGNKPPYLSKPYVYYSENKTNKNTKAGTPSSIAKANPDSFQLNIIGGFTDAFHFYPVIIHQNKAIINLHNNVLESNTEYYVTIDSGVFKLRNTSFKGIEKGVWQFKTREDYLCKYNDLTVSQDGNGCFNTIQGAIDFVPDYSPKTIRIKVNPGKYEEIVYFRNKKNLIIEGTHPDSVEICYANNEIFNPHPENVSTNEWPGTFPSRRAVFMADNSYNITLKNLTFRNLTTGQAEALLLMGEKFRITNCKILGSGDALQANGSCYFEECLITGHGDTYLGRGPSYFDRCTIQSTAVFAWVRNTDKNHGVVFRNCIFEKDGPGETELARAPDNKGYSYPYAEMVLLNCSLKGISKVGWGQVGKDHKNIKYYEFNSKNHYGKLIDPNERHPVSRTLAYPQDSSIINYYNSPQKILNWSDLKIKYQTQQQ